MTWQPIATSPQDGRRMLLWDPHDERVEIGGRTVHDDPVRAWLYDTGEYGHPSRWMPLPEPREALMAENPETFRVGEWSEDEDGLPIMVGEPGTSGEHMVAWVHGWGWGQEYAERMARQIAATRDLLAACELVDGELSDPRMIQVAIPRLRKVLRAAIAKATGGSDG